MIKKILKSSQTCHQSTLLTCILLVFLSFSSSYLIVSTGQAIKFEEAIDMANNTWYIQFSFYMNEILTLSWFAFYVISIDRESQWNHAHKISNWLWTQKISHDCSGSKRRKVQYHSLVSFLKLKYLTYGMYYG